MDYSPTGSSVHGIFQARVLEWGAIAFSDMYVRECKGRLVPYTFICQYIKFVYIWECNMLFLRFHHFLNTKARLIVSDKWVFIFLAKKMCMGFPFFFWNKYKHLLLCTGTLPSPDTLSDFSVMWTGLTDPRQGVLGLWFLQPESVSGSFMGKPILIQGCVLWFSDALMAVRAHLRFNLLHDSYPCSRWLAAGLCPVPRLHVVRWAPITHHLIKWICSDLMGERETLSQSEGQGHYKCREQEIYFGHQILHNWKGTCKENVRKETRGRENEPATNQTSWEHIQPGNTRAGWGTLCSTRLPLWVLSKCLVLSPSLWLVGSVGSGEGGLDEEWMELRDLLGDSSPHLIRATFRVC